MIAMTMLHLTQKRRYVFVAEHIKSDTSEFLFCRSVHAKFIVRRKFDWRNVRPLSREVKRD